MGNIYVHDVWHQHDRFLYMATLVRWPFDWNLHCLCAFQPRHYILSLSAIYSPASPIHIKEWYRCDNVYSDCWCPLHAPVILEFSVLLATILRSVIARIGMLTLQGFQTWKAFEKKKTEVKSSKQHLRQIVGNPSMPFEELTTVPTRRLWRFYNRPPSASSRTIWRISMRSHPLTSSAGNHRMFCVTNLLWKKEIRTNKLVNSLWWSSTTTNRLRNGF